MMRSAPLKRKPFPSRPWSASPREDRVREVPRLYRVPAPAPSEPVFRPSPKRAYIRSDALIEAYRLLPCQFEGCGFVGERSIVGAHSNWSCHGKGRNIKADDNRAASACPTCHYELDFGKRWGEEEKQRKWWVAHTRTVNLLVLRGLWPAGVPVPETGEYPKEWNE